MAPLQPGDLAIRFGGRLDWFANGVCYLFWGAVFFWLAWLVADPANQLGSWLAPVNSVPVPVRIIALVVIAGFFSAQGILITARSFRPVAAILSREGVSFPTLFGWRKVAWNNVVRVTLGKGRFMTFEMRDGRGWRPAIEVIDLFRATPSKHAIARKLSSIRPNLAEGWSPAPTLSPSPPDPFRQEGDFGHHIWP